MSAAASARAGPGRAALPMVPALAWAALLALLAWHFAGYLQFAASSLAFPFELNYGEGIVWQQALLIPGPRMYGDISRYPHIPFQYPPLYHLAVRLVAAFGVDGLLAGRSVSLAATLVGAALMAALAWQGCRGAGPRRALLAATLVGLALFTLAPITRWSVLMRVDMLGVTLTWLGLLLGVLALRRPWLLHAAVLACVAALFARQTLIAAPIAVLAVHLLRDPRHAIGAALSGLVAGLAALGALSWATGGGFLRHIVLYNFARYDIGVAWAAFVWMMRPCGIYLLGAAVSLGLHWRMIRREGAPDGWLRRLRRDDALARSFMFTIYLGVAGASLLSLGKSGADINYCIETTAAACLWVGLLLGLRLPPAAPGRVAKAGAVLVPLLLAVQVLYLAPRVLAAPQAEAYAQEALLEQRVRALSGPILSDNMVVLLRTGREVPLEPASVAEMTAMGTWTSQPLLALIERRAFAAVITDGDPGGQLMQARYPPEAIAAILAHYPDVTPIGPWRLRLPR